MKYMPQEIEVWYVIPAIRRELAKAMAAAGLMQKDIAARLGLTEPAVSQYIKSKRGKDVVFPKDIQDRILQAAKRIMRDDNLMMAEVQAVCNMVKKKGLLCKIACRYYDAPRDCCVCMR
ncbi:transcriptional regulator [Candidatus Woesearchaeota archaeon]|nr:transcriptional regulator [Candidatus Woesearchaeota archaeon]